MANACGIKYDLYVRKMILRVYICSFQLQLLYLSSIDIWFEKMFTLNSFNFLLFFFFFLLLIGMELNIKYLERNYNRNINHEKKY